jgi:hypothetical protein
MGRSDGTAQPRPQAARRATREVPPLDEAGLERVRLEFLAQSLSAWNGGAPEASASPPAALLKLPGEYSDAGDVTSLALAEIEAQRREIRVLKARLRELELLVEDCTTRTRQGG